MKIIKLNAIPSTNTFLSELSQTLLLDDFTVVVTKSQTNGKGQRGAGWQSEKGKNLTFSVLCDVSRFKNTLFLWNCLVAVSLVNALKKISKPSIAIKWPNDIMSESKKIAGILIENRFLASGKVQSIVGIGLNVNQTEFIDLPHASSLALLNNKHFHLLPILKKIVFELQYNLENLKNESEIWAEYHSCLFRYNEVSHFETENAIFKGTIKGVSREGLLTVQKEDDSIQEFDIKAIKMLLNKNIS